MSTFYFIFKFYLYLLRAYYVSARPCIKDFANTILFDEFAKQPDQSCIFISIFQRK